MRRVFAWVGGAFGAAALWRFLRGRREEGSVAPAPADDPAGELRRRLAEAREAADDRDDFDAAEGVPVDAAEPAPGGGSSVDERRRAVHEQAQDALDRMRREPADPDA